MNCHHFRATQKSIPDAQELIWLGGGVKRPHPAPLGLIQDTSVSRGYMNLQTNNVFHICNGFENYAHIWN